MEEKISLDGKNPYLITLPSGCSIRWNNDDTATVISDNPELVKEFKKNVAMAVSSIAPTSNLHKHVLSNVALLENMWSEYSEIKQFRRPAVIVLVVNVEFAVNLVLAEYGKKDFANRNSNLTTKAKELLDMNIIDDDFFRDLDNLWQIRNLFAHDILIDKDKAENDFKTRVGSFRCSARAIPNSIKTDDWDNRFAHCCYFLLTRVLDKYWDKNP